MAAMPGGPDLSNAEIVEWFVDEGDGKIRIKVKEGAVLELHTVITGVLRIGNDPATGFPVYNIQSQNLVKLLSAERKVRKAPLRPPGPTEGTSGMGVG